MGGPRKTVLLNEVSQMKTNIKGYQQYVESKKKKDKSELIYKTETDIDFKTNLWLPKGKGGGRDRLGVSYWHIHIIAYGMDGQWRLAVYIAQGTLLNTL